MTAPRELPPPSAGQTGWPWVAPASAPPAVAAANLGAAPPGISVVMPSYQQAEFLEEAIRSVLMQGYPRLELIVMDGGSKDGSVDILRKYEPHLAYWTSAPDGGQTAAINAGWRRAQYEIVTWLNSDDLLLPGWAHATARAFLDDAALDVTYTDIVVMDLDARTEVTVPAHPPVLDKLITRWMSGLSQQGTALRRRVLDRCGLLNEALHYTMDTEYWRRTLAAGCRYAHVSGPGPLAVVRMYQQTKTRGQRLKVMQELVDLSVSFADSCPPELRALGAEGRRLVHWNAAHMLLEGGFNREARRFALRHLRDCGWRAAPRVGGMVALSLLGRRGHDTLQALRQMRARIAAGARGSARGP